jgi:hypothetical protein
MQPSKKAGRIIGLLFLIIIALGGTSLNLRGLNSSLLAADDLLARVFEQAFEMKLAIVLNLAAGLLWLGIAIYLFPFVKQISKSLALWLLSLWLIQFGTTLMGDIAHLSLINLSQQVQGMPVADLIHYKTIGKVLINEYFWGHFFSLMGYSSATFILFLAIFKGRWLPRFIPVWGMAAMTVVFFASAVQLFDIEVSFLFYQQNGIHFIVMTLWLLFFGFKVKSPVSRTELE